MIGDHHQLPPVVKHLAFQKYCEHGPVACSRASCGWETPYHRSSTRRGARAPKLAELVPLAIQGRWATCPNTVARRIAVRAGESRDSRNAAQFVDVGEYSGVGEESPPTPHFYQNLGEAEYVVSACTSTCACCGYPAEKISIMTTYNAARSTCCATW